MINHKIELYIQFIFNYFYINFTVFSQSTNYFYNFNCAFTIICFY